MKMVIAAALLAAPATAGAADPAALCGILLMDMVLLADERPDLAAELRAAVQRALQEALRSPKPPR